MTQSEKVFFQKIPRVTVDSRLRRYFEILCETVDSPRSLACWILLREKEYHQLVSLEIDPNHYNSAHSFGNDYLVTRFLSKYPGFRHPNLAPAAKALESFLDFERQSKLTNVIFKAMKEDSSAFKAANPAMHSILQNARGKIRHVLGSVRLEKLDCLFRWGPGATSVSRGSFTSAYIKYAQRLDVTYNALIIGRSVVNSRPAWVNTQLTTEMFPSVNASLLDSAFSLRRGNEIVFVPKNAKTHRTIAKEPHLNSYIQAGIGRYIRERLSVIAGVDLQDQSINQRLARLGSLTGTLATLDLKGASDTISNELVRFLLPPKWYSLLNSVRSPQGLLDQEWIHYEKFSSMGNSATFELESLIFWALCSSCLEHNRDGGVLSVYGDDLIVPTESVPLVRKVLRFCGFQINETKSFSSGRFRESCGADYFDGISVKPFYLKEELCNVESLYRLANRVRIYAHNNHFGGCDARFQRLWKAIVSDIPISARYFIVPHGFGDVGLVGNFDEACPTRARDGWEGYYFSAVIRRPKKLRMQDMHGAFTSYLSANDAERTRPADRLPASGFHTLRDRTQPSVARLYTRGWYDLGPWT